MEPDDLDALVAAARQAAVHAYAPFSRYRVGAALRTASGEIVTGVNVENSSFGLSNCAERSAVFGARTKGLVDPANARIAAVAIHASGGPMPFPCGACRQVLSEFSSPSTVVIVDGDGETVRTTMGELLPRAFRLEGS